MNENKLDFHSEYGNHSSCQYFGIRQQPWNMGPCNNQPLSATCVGVGVGRGRGGGGGEQEVVLPYSAQAKPSSTIISRFESPASAFYATEIFMGFPQYDSHQVGNPSNLMPHQLSIKNINNDMEFPLYQSSKESLFFDSSVNDQNSPNNFELPNTLQAIKSQWNGDQCNGSPEKSNKIPCGNFPASNFLPIEQHKLFNDDAAPVTRSISIPKANQESTVACGSFNSPVQQLSFSSPQEKLSPTISAGNLVGNGPIASSKTRIRWTQDLHEKFVECVNRLGGAEKATPKAILRLMDSDGLTIFHVKSHLQKYRIAKYMPESTQGSYALPKKYFFPFSGKSEKRTSAENVHLDVKAGLQIKEALQLQLDVQRRLHEQLEIQRKLQLQIEEQGKQLKMMFDRQQKSNNSERSSKDNNNDDNEVTILEGTGISHFPSKIS
ncbi:uncharacterized protein [Arachis hypogaea]|uniref:HTH myb-type domain-containing protein n=1 Tax=Arachis hypogaea TaxID=3818 RepID=A0A445BMX4_ARAHY|nr:myb family transcription factor PHL5 isoform X1 [Arachis hypogaea]QHO33850.1 Myb family transcription factor APL [Arachis hypogaea]RYR40017.1 hypothetical protein Ahy_A09g045675 [Arachis hypogaea]